MPQLATPRRSASHRAYILRPLGVSSGAARWRRPHSCLQLPAAATRAAPRFAAARLDGTTGTQSCAPK